MSTEIFSYTVHQPYAEGVIHLTEISEAQGGRENRLARYPAYGIFRVSRSSLRFDVAGNALSTFVTFFNARQGRYDTWLYAPLYDAFGLVTAEALGTGAGVATDFALDSKYIVSATLLVYVGGVLQTSGYSLVTNYTTPIVRFTGAPTGVITATYHRYYPCRFEQDELQITPKMLAGTDDTSVLVVENLSWRQNYAGSHLV